MSIIHRACSATSRTRSSHAQVHGGDEDFDGMAGLLQRCPAALLPVHHGEDAQHAAPRRGDRGDRVRRRVARGDHVFDHDDGGSGRETPFDALSGPVSFRLLADREGVERSALGVGGSDDGVGHGIGAEREAPDQGGRPAPGVEALEPQGADEGEAFPRHGGAARIDVEAGPAPRGEREVAVSDRSLPQELAEASLKVPYCSHRAISSSICYYYRVSRRTTRLSASNQPSLRPDPVGPPVTPTVTSSANAATVGCRLAGSRSRPRITAASRPGGNRRSGAAWLNGRGGCVSSCWNSSRGVRPVWGCWPVSSQYVIVARL